MSIRLVCNISPLRLKEHEKFLSFFRGQLVLCGSPPEVACRDPGLLRSV